MGDHTSSLLRLLHTRTETRLLAPPLSAFLGLLSECLAVGPCCSTLPSNGSSSSRACGIGRPHQAACNITRPLSRCILLKHVQSCRGGQSRISVVHEVRRAQVSFFYTNPVSPMPRRTDDCPSRSGAYPCPYPYLVVVRTTTITLRLLHVCRACLNYKHHLSARGGLHLIRPIGILARPFDGSSRFPDIL